MAIKREKLSIWSLGWASLQFGKLIHFTKYMIEDRQVFAARGEDLGEELRCRTLLDNFKGARDVGFTWLEHIFVARKSDSASQAIFQGQ